MYYIYVNSVNRARYRVALVVTRADEMGGAQAHVMHLAEILLTEGHEVTVLAGREGVFSKALQSHGITFRLVTHLRRPVDLFQDFLCIRELRLAFREIAPNLIGLHSSKAGWLGRIAAAGLRVPVIFTAHGWAFSDGVPAMKQLLYRWAERLAAPLASKVITVCEYDKQLAIRERVVPPEKLVTVRNGIPANSSACLADPLRQPPRIVMVSRFAAQKDHALLARALSRVRHLQWTCVFVGDGPLRQRTECDIQQLRLTDRFEFLGERTDVPEILAGSQLFVLATNWEGLPIAILEAMRAGLPVIATNVGGVRETIEDGATGFLVPRGNVGEMSRRVETLLTDPHLRARMGNQGKSRFERYFTVGRMAEETLRVYETACGRSSG